MGYLLYDQQRYHFEDRLLVHLRLAIARKFRQHESFFLEWAESPHSGGGRVSIWIDPTHYLGFRFIDSQTPELNLAWVDAMAETRAPHRCLVAISERQAMDSKDANEDLQHFAPAIESPTSIGEAGEDSSHA